MHCFDANCKHIYGKEFCKFFHINTDVKNVHKGWKYVMDRRPGKIPSKNDRLCSCHFKDGEKQNGPTIFNGKEIPKLVKKQLRQKNKKKLDQKKSKHGRVYNSHNKVGKKSKGPKMLNRKKEVLIQKKRKQGESKYPETYCENYDSEETISVKNEPNDEIDFSEQSDKNPGETIVVSQLPKELEDVSVKEEFCIEDELVKEGLNIKKNSIQKEQKYSSEFDKESRDSSCKIQSEVKDFSPKNYKFKCSVCKLKYTILDDLVFHMRNHEGPKSYVCCICDKHFNVYFKLRIHFSVHEEPKVRDLPYICPICGKGFPKPSKLKRHQSVHTNNHLRRPKPYECQVCAKKFHQLSNLRSHNETHANLKCIECNICQKKFCYWNNLKAHMDSHNKNPPECSICHKTFSVLSDYKKHTSYKCRICQEKFRCEEEYRQHKKMNKSCRRRKEHKSTECIVCKLKFSCFRTLQEHMRLHVDEKPYECIFCSKKYAILGKLRSHVLENHGINNSNIVYCIKYKKKNKINSKPLLEKDNNLPT